MPRLAGVLFAVTALAGAALSLLEPAAVAAPPREIALREVRIDLPASPAAIVPADFNGDGRKDLFVLVAYTEWGSIGGEDRVEKAVQISEVVPALFERREARLFLAAPSGQYLEAVPALPVPTSVHAVEAGPSALPVVAITDEGLSVFQLRDGEKGKELRLESVFADPPVLAGSGQFLTTLDLVRDVTGDGADDLLFPARDGIAVYPGEGDRFADAPASRLHLPGDRRATGTNAYRRYPLPRVEDVDGDAKPDLVLFDRSDRDPVRILRGLGNGTFAPAQRVGLGCLELSFAQEKGRKKEANESESTREIAWFGDLDGDGVAEVVTRVQVDTGKKDLAQFRDPLFQYRFHRMSRGLVVDKTPYTTLDAIGYAFSGSFRDGVDLVFLDLDGDRRRDLITVTLDFSVFQIVRVFTEKKVTVGLEFQLFAQQADGRFRKVTGQKLDEKLKLDLDELRIGRMAQIRGDFDGDGKTDFVHLGRGKAVTIHRGQPGCRYAEKPDMTVLLEEEPDDVGLVRIEDFDGDGLSDLSVIRVLPPPDEAASAPARIELRLSGGIR